MNTQARPGAKRKKTASGLNLLHGLDAWPPPGTTGVLALQWLVALVPGLLVMGEVVAVAQDFSGPEKTGFLQRVLLLCGLVQVGQVLWGHRLPGVAGTSAVLMVGAIGTAYAGAATVYGAMAAGGAFMALLGVFGLAARLGRLFTPPVLASTLILVSVTLTPSLLPLLFSQATAGGGTISFAFGLGLTLAMLWAQNFFKGLLSSAVLVMGMVLGSAVFHLAGLGPDTGFSLAGDWFALPALPAHGLEFNPGVIAAFCLCYLAVISNELATVGAVGEMVGAPKMNSRRNRTVLTGGLGGLLAGLIGVPGPVTYSVSPAMVITTKSSSRFILLPVGAGLIVLALCPLSLDLFSLAPPPVVGGVLLMLLASTAYAALGILDSQGGVTWRSGSVVGTALLTGLSVAFMPSEVRDSVPSLLRPLLANGFVVGLVVALLLEHLLLPREPRHP